MACLLKINNVFRLKTMNLYPGVCLRTFRRGDTPLPDPVLAKKVLFTKKPISEQESYPGEFAIISAHGRIYDKKPFPIWLEADRSYNWCTCGYSKSQPICDGSHKRLDGTEFIKRRPLFRPLAFSVDKSAEYHLCNCKQTNNRPFCDGTHRRSDIQETNR